jgi:hypothetical protein
MKLISQLQNYWNKLLLKKYKKGNRVEFIYKVNSIPRKCTGIIDNVYEQSRFPYCIKLDHPFEYNGWIVSYVNIKLKEIICKN